MSLLLDALRQAETGRARVTAGAELALEPLAVPTDAPAPRQAMNDDADPAPLRVIPASRTPVGPAGTHPTADHNATQGSKDARIEAEVPDAVTTARALMPEAAAPTSRAHGLLVSGAALAVALALAAFLALDTGPDGDTPLALYTPPPARDAAPAPGTPAGATPGTPPAPEEQLSRQPAAQAVNRTAATARTDDGKAREPRRARATPERQPAPETRRAPAAIATHRAPLDDAWLAWQAGDAASAQRLYGEAMRANPKSVDALLGLAITHEALGDRTQARALYIRLLDIDPQNTQALAALAPEFARQDAARAESRLRDRIAATDDAGLHFALGNLMAAQGRWQEAKTHYAAAASLETGNAQFAFNLAVALDNLQATDDARYWYEKTVAIATGRGTVATLREESTRRLSEMAAASSPVAAP